VGVTQGYYLFYAAPYVLTLGMLIATSLDPAMARGAGRIVDHEMRGPR
jgi:general nucleoside transport system permease protein